MLHLHADALLQRKLIAEACPNATIVELIDEQLVPMVLELCHQLQILVMPNEWQNGKRTWLTVDQMMSLAASGPQLQTVVIEKFRCLEKDWNEVDYSAVKLAFPKLRFVEDVSVFEYDALNMPI